MQIQKKYMDIKPELLFDELKDLVVKQGAVVDKSKMETYSLPNNSSSFISRGMLIFKIEAETGRGAKECIRGHIFGSARGETKLLLDIDESLFPVAKVTALQEDLDFILGSYESK